MHDSEMTAAFKEYAPMLWHRAHSWNLTTRVDAEELHGEAVTAFVRAYRTYDPERGASFSHWLYRIVDNALHKFTARQLQIMTNAMGLVEGVPDHHGELHPYTAAHGHDMISELTEEAQEVARYVLESGAEMGIRGRDSRRRAIRKVREYLREAGWTYREIWSCFREIRALLASLP